MTDYPQSVLKFETLTDTALTMAMAVSSSYTQERLRLGANLFGKICMHATVILRLLPKSLYSKTVNHTVTRDLSSVCALIKILIDNYYLFYYLIAQDVGENELGFRFCLWNYHSMLDQKQFLKLQMPESLKIAEIDTKFRVLAMQLFNNSFYLILEASNFNGIKDKVSKIKAGQLGIFYDNSEVANVMGLNSQAYQAVFSYLSSHVNTEPLAVVQWSAFRGDDAESLQTLRTVVDFCSDYLSFTLRDMVKIFPDQKVYLTSEISRQINHWEEVFRLDAN